jgi:hypothetical protein
MTDLEQAVYDTIDAELSRLTDDQLIAALQRNALDGQKMGVIVPGSGCRFCLPQRDGRRSETEPQFECDLRACMIHSLVSHTLGILQDADLMVDRTNLATARNRLTYVLLTIFSEQKSTEIAARLLKTLETTDHPSLNDGWAD